MILNPSFTIYFFRLLKCVLYVTLFTIKKKFKIDQKFKKKAFIKSFYFNYMESPVCKSAICLLPKYRRVVLQASDLEFQIHI